MKGVISNEQEHVAEGTVSATEARKWLIL